MISKRSGGLSSLHRPSLHSSQDQRWSRGPPRRHRSAVEELLRAGVLSRLCRVRALEDKRQQARLHEGVWSHPTSCWWAGPYRTNVSNMVNVSMKSIRIIVDLFYYGYSVDTYPMRIHVVSDTDMYPIRDTSLSWSIGVTESRIMKFHEKLFITKRAWPNIFTHRKCIQYGHGFQLWQRQGSISSTFTLDLNE
jgi:hypothetical protein